MPSTKTITPIQKSIHVRCDQATAFRVFTRELATWWPLDSHALHAGDVREVIWEERVGGEVYEISTRGEKAHWAEVTVWDPPARLAIAWKVNPDAASTTDVEVTFTSDLGGTRVDLTHSGWERLGDSGPEARQNYDSGWVVVLGRYEASLDSGTTA